MIIYGASSSPSKNDESDDAIVSQIQRAKHCDKIDFDRPRAAPEIVGVVVCQESHRRKRPSDYDARRPSPKVFDGFDRHCARVA